MIDLIAFLLGAATLYAGQKIGEYKQRRKSIREPEPICGCKHHFSFHDPEGKCTKVVEWHWQGDVKVFPTCTCQHYTGPEPMPRYIS